jgi:hypothetical protein
MVDVDALYSRRPLIFHATNPKGFGTTSIDNSEISNQQPCSRELSEMLETSKDALSEMKEPPRESDGLLLTSNGELYRTGWLRLLAPASRYHRRWLAGVLGIVFAFSLQSPVILDRFLIQPILRFITA